MPDPELKVLLGDLSAASAIFETEAILLGNITPSGPGGIPDGGADNIDNAMKQAAQLLSNRHSQLITALNDRAQSLQSAYDTYNNTDAQLSQVISDLWNAANAADGTIYRAAPVPGSGGAPVQGSGT
jgi:Family of unknown function (DUF6317)